MDGEVVETVVTLVVTVLVPVVLTAVVTGAVTGAGTEVVTWVVTGVMTVAATEVVTVVVTGVMTVVVVAGMYVVVNLVAFSVVYVVVCVVTVVMIAVGYVMVTSVGMDVVVNKDVLWGPSVVTAVVVTVVRGHVMVVVRGVAAVNGALVREAEIGTPGAGREERGRLGVGRCLEAEVYGVIVLCDTLVVLLGEAGLVFACLYLSLACFILFLYLCLSKCFPEEFVLQTLVLGLRRMLVICLAISSLSRPSS